MGQRAEPTPPAEPGKGNPTTGIAGGAARENSTPLAAVLVLSALESKYTLVYRETGILGGVGDRGDGASVQDARGGGNQVFGEKVAGGAAGSEDYERLRGDDAAAPLGEVEGSAGLDLVLVEGYLAPRTTKGSDWLLGRAKAILLEGVKR